MRSLLKKGTAFVWTKDIDTAFTHIKNLVINAPALSPFVPGHQCTITVDASLKGLGAVFGQHIFSKDHTVSFASRSLSEAESKYSTIEREALACV